MRNNLFSKLTPKEPKFFPLLSGLSYCRDFGLDD